MKYFEVKFLINSVSPANDPVVGTEAHATDEDAFVRRTACDLLAALAGEAGFETFEESAGGLTGYVQQQLFERAVLDELLANFPMPDVKISYSVSKAEDRDWNEQWEEAGFEPIIVRGEAADEEGGDEKAADEEGDEEAADEEGDEKAADEEGTAPGAFGGQAVVIHDGRHLPNLSSFDAEQTTFIEIDAHLAFGTGTHETTRMVCAELLNVIGKGLRKEDKGLHAEDKELRSEENELRSEDNIQSPLRLLDCGTGTGILAICALKLGAADAVGYDIDEWSVDNARHNAVINGVDQRFTQLHGDASVLNHVEGVFQVVTANINRNILLADLPAFRSKMADGGVLILSGFYTADIPLLTERAATLGLTVIRERHDNSWACLTLNCVAGTE